MDRIYNQSKRGLFNLIAMLIFLATLGLTGCASQSNAASSTATKPAQPSQETQAASGASAQGVLRVTANPIAQTDPAKISSDAEVLIANHVYDYLVDIDPNNEIQPRLATSWTHSSDGLSYTFSLARGVTFHDGSPLTAEDVVWTFNRLRDPPVIGSDTHHIECLRCDRVPIYPDNKRNAGNQFQWFSRQAGRSHPCRDHAYYKGHSILV